MGRRCKITVALVLFLALVLAVCALLCAWYFTPRTFLRGVEPREVDRISVFDGNTGKQFFIDRDSDIGAIIENIQSIKMKRGKVSSNYDGFAFSLTFLDNEGEPIDSFIINGLNTIRDDPFFYHTSEGVLCYEHLGELEREYFGEDGQ